MRVVIDDQLALLVRLGALELPQAVDLPALTTYAFDLRVASAIATERTTQGVLQRVLSMYGPDTGVERILQSSGSVRVMDPTRLTIEIARAKAELRCTLLPAEVVAVARATEAVVRLSAGNADSKLEEVLVAASIQVEVWTLEEREGRLWIVEP